MKRIFFAAAFVAALALCAAPRERVFALPLWTADALWSSVWDGSSGEDELLESAKWLNRAELKAALPRLGLSIKMELVDKRDMPPSNWDWDAAKNVTGFGAGLYIKDSPSFLSRIAGDGSRVLFGNIEEKGLPARLRNTWLRSAPWSESHAKTTADLLTSSSASAVPQFYALFESPRLFAGGVFGSGISVFSTALVGQGARRAVSAGLDAALSKGLSVRLEGYHYNDVLAERKAGGWFSPKTWLPQREQKLYAASASAVLSPAASLSVHLAGEAALSDVFAFGHDVYANAALTVKRPPFKVDVAVDGAGSRWTGTDGTVEGAGGRFGARVEWSGVQSRLFRAQTTLRSSEAFGDLNRSENVLYYRFAVPRKRDKVFLRPLTVRLEAGRNGSDANAIIDSYTLNMSGKAGAVKASLSINIKNHVTAAGFFTPFPVVFNEQAFKSFKGALSVSVPVQAVTLSLSSDVNMSDTKPTYLCINGGASLKTRHGSLTLKAGHSGNNDVWSYSLGWKLTGSLKGAQR